MSAALPVKQADRIHNEIAELLLMLRGYLPPDDERLVRWNDELDRAMPAGRATAFLVMAVVRHLSGDIDGMERFLTRAEFAGANDLEIAFTRIPMYQNLGFASKALDDCRTLYSVAALNIGAGLPTILTCGAFGFAAELLEAARLAKLDLSHVPQIRQIVQIAEGAAMHKVDDEQYAKVLDVAGEVMRAHSLFWLERSPRFSFDSEMRCAGLRYRVDISPEEAVALTADFTDRLIDSGLADVPLTFRFIGTRLESAVAVPG